MNYNTKTLHKWFSDSSWHPIHLNMLKICTCACHSDVEDRECGPLTYEYPGQFKELDNAHNSLKSSSLLSISSWLFQRHLKSIMSKTILDSPLKAPPLNLFSYSVFVILVYGTNLYLIAYAIPLVFWANVINSVRNNFWQMLNVKTDISTVFPLILVHPNVLFA